VKLHRKDTDFFYNQVAKPLLDALDIELKVPFFNLNDFKTIVFEQNSVEDSKLIELYKILSPTHLLKLPFANDSNQLDKHFYSELLHIIGLEEVKEGSKKLIQRKVNRNEFSLLENTLSKIENRGYLEPYPMALELCITWINRVLFLKLLEAQLVVYHKGNKDYCFLNTTMIQDYSRLNKLFFEVLAERTENRKGKTQLEFEKIPYLNSSLFELTPLEQIITMNDLDRGETMPIADNTVLKDAHGKKQIGELPTLEYLLAFLDSYDFASEGSEAIQPHKRTLINASVLGLIFEKINGYKDGSFFTPGFITMYMSRETIRRAVIQKFKDSKQPHFQQITTIEDLSEAITDKKQANDWVNELKICDPAVGSGHFLVSALNEIIAIKADLGILLFRDGKRVRNFEIFVQNDELIVTDEDTGDIFQYYVNEKGIPPKEVQRVQEMLFHEKQTIIENCLFGVDINPNSVKICRLRLWIELLKNAYYTENSQYKALETLPNIDINIKKGNSLISRFKLKDDLSDVFKKQKFSYPAYRKAVENYKNTNSKPAKAALSAFIAEIKSEFQTVFHKNIKEFRDYAKLKGQLYMLRTQGDMFGQGIDAVEEERLEKLVEQAQLKVKAIQENVIYQDAFEWRFEFPEILDKNGVFVGFDVVIGNPPYGVSVNKMEKDLFASRFKTLTGEVEIYTLFIEFGFEILKQKGYISYVTSNTWYYLDKFKVLRKHILDNNNIQILAELEKQVFADAPDIVPAIFVIKNDNHKTNEIITLKAKETKIIYDFNALISNQVKVENYYFGNHIFNLLIDNQIVKLLEKVKCFKPLNLYFKVIYGIKTGDNKSNLTKSVDNKGNWKKCASSANNIKRYEITWQQDYLNVGNHLQGLGKTNYEQPKILIQYIRKLSMPMRLVCALDEVGSLYPLNNFSFIISPNQGNLKFLLGLINSKLMNWYFSNTFIDYNIKPKYIEQLPIVEIAETEQQPIIEHVEKILALKKAEPSQSTTELEKEIDKMVYVLYGLTEAEIAEIEQSFA
jgi:hypothetical protein